jgi:phosphoheptose isomerase
MGYDEVFAHQVYVLSKPGDLVICMTTSCSENILKARNVAKNKEVDFYLFDKNNIFANGVADRQELILAELHNTAREVKEMIYGS